MGSSFSCVCSILVILWRLWSLFLKTPYNRKYRNKSNEASKGIARCSKYNHTSYKSKYRYQNGSKNNYIVVPSFMFQLKIKLNFCLVNPMNFCFVNPMLQIFYTYKLNERHRRIMVLYQSTVTLIVKFTEGNENIRKGRLLSVPRWNAIILNSSAQGILRDWLQGKCPFLIFSFEFTMTRSNLSFLQNIIFII